MKVLVADDSQPIRKRLVERLLRLSGVIVEEAVDAAEAIRSTDTFKPDVAVLDIRMPSGGGIKVLGAIKRQRPDTTVIMMTNYPYAQYRRKCLESGADFFFDKSSEFEQVAETVCALIQGERVSEVARRTAASQLVTAKEQIEEIEQRRHDMGLLSLMQEPDTTEDFDQAYAMWVKTFDAIPDMIAILDANQKIVRVNKVMADRLGVSAYEATGKKCHEYIHGTSCPAENCPHEQMLRDGREHEVEMYEERLGGWFNIRVSPIYEKGRLIGAIHVARDFTARKQAEALAHSTLDALSAHIAIVDPDGVIMAVNCSWEQFAKQNRLLCCCTGMNYLAVCDTARGSHEDDARQFAMGLRGILRGDSESFEMEYSCEIETEVLWFCGRITSFAGKPRMAVIAHEDITARKRAENEIKESETRYHQLFESMQAGFALHEIICNEQGIPVDYRFLEVNSAFEALTGLKSDKLVGKTVREVLPATETHWIETYGRVALTGTAVRVDNYSSALGRYYSVSAYSPSKGQFATVFYDITEQKNAEAAIHHALDTAEEANRTKTQFLANMSHELRTPLNAIIGLTELLEDTPLNDEQRDYIKTVGTSGEALLSIISDLLDFSKIEMGKMEIKKEPLRVSEVVCKAMALLSLQADQKGIELRSRIDASAPEQISSDPVRLQQVLVNLLNNAVKFTDKGFVRLTVCGRLVPSGSHVVEFSVQDSGAGIDADTMKRIFIPFQQGDSSSTREHGGTGLGLAISKNLVEMMGGAIRAESHPGQGSLFSFRIMDHKLLQDRVSVKKLHESWRGRCLCVWGDDPADLRAAEHLLERCGIMPRYAENIDMINDSLTHDVCPDAVLCNLDMPGLAERLSVFRAAHPDTPWIAFSNWTVPVDEQIRICFSAFIDRPLQSEQLYSALSQLTANW